MHFINDEEDHDECDRKAPVLTEFTHILEGNVDNTQVFTDNKLIQDCEKCQRVSRINKTRKDFLRLADKWKSLRRWPLSRDLKERDPPK